MQKCPLCFTEVPDDSPAVLAEIIDKEVSWHSFESDSAQYGKPIGHKFNIPGVGIAEVVAKKAKYDTGDLGTGYYGGESELPQGTEFDVFVVLKVGENFYRKTGTGDSYGEVFWTGNVRPVQGVAKTVIVYEWA